MRLFLWLAILFNVIVSIPNDNQDIAAGSAQSSKPSWFSFRKKKDEEVTNDQQVQKKSRWFHWFRKPKSEPQSSLSTAPQQSVNPQYNAQQPEGEGVRFNPTVQTRRYKKPNFFRGPTYRDGTVDLQGPAEINNNLERKPIIPFSPPRWKNGESLDDYRTKLENARSAKEYRLRAMQRYNDRLKSENSEEE